MGSGRFDVVVAGGGLAGLVAAASLARAGFEAVVVEGRARDAPDDGRVSALTVASERILRRLGVWERIAEAAAPFREIEVWEADGGAGIRFEARAIGEAHLGCIVENRVIAAALEDAGDALGVGWRRPARVSGITLGRGEVIVDPGGSAPRLRAGLLVGADGSGSLVRALAGIPVRSGSYGQLGIVCAVRPERHHGDVARQVFRPAGPLAFLPLPDGLCSIVWSTGRGHGQHLLGLPDEEFRAALENAFERRLGRIEWTGARAGFPLRRVQASTYRAPRVALVGDAAHTIHPLAGQGVNLGILDAAVLSEEVEKAARRGRDPGGRAALLRYERRRKGHNLAAQWTMDGFYRLFRPRLPPVRLLRNLGLAATDRLAPIKNRLMRRASGFDGDLPS